jgi:predicted RNase H-like HicB family nuclease
LETAVKYTIVYEQTPNNWSAYVPDLPGCVAAADTREETRQLIVEAIAQHLELMTEYNEPVPQPGTWTDEIEVDIPTAHPRGRSAG